MKALTHFSKLFSDTTVQSVSLAVSNPPVAHLEIELVHDPPFASIPDSISECCDAVSEVCSSSDKDALQHIVVRAREIVSSRPFIQNASFPIDDQLRNVIIPLSCSSSSHENFKQNQRNHTLHVVSLSLVVNEDDPPDVPESSHLALLSKMPHLDSQKPMFTSVPFWRVQLRIHTYSLYPPVPIAWQHLDSNTTNDDDDDANIDMSCIETIRLPSVTLTNSWQSLYYPKNFKARLLSYARAILTVSGATRSTIVRATGLIILHGPPGGGKTTLASALAHRLSVRMNKTGLLIRVSPQALFSKWFGESATKVGSLFRQVHALVTSTTAAYQPLVAIILDEVDAIARSRDASASGTDPGDALRVVNALLVGIDMLAGTGVLIIATTNFLNAVDHAFRDRADLCLYVGAMEEHAVGRVVQESILEMVRAGIVNHIDKDHDSLLEPICRMCQGLSGRALRRLPVLALGMVNADVELPIEQDLFLNALKGAVGQVIGDDKKSIEGTLSEMLSSNDKVRN